MNVRFILYSFIIITAIQNSVSLWCLDGSDCSSSDSCGLCEGSACLRVQRFNPAKGPSVALTCLPHDSLIHIYHPEGCRTELSSGEKLCLCSNRDFCNSSNLSLFHYVHISVLIFILL